MGLSDLNEDFGKAAAGGGNHALETGADIDGASANDLFAVSKPFAIRDVRLVTGQHQYSGREVAELIIEVLGVLGLLQ